MFLDKVTDYMKKYLTLSFFGLLLINTACKNKSANNPEELNQTEKNAVEDRIKNDEAAMDSLEKIIQAQINETDTITK